MNDGLDNRYDDGAGSGPPNYSIFGLAYVIGTIAAGVTICAFALAQVLS